MQKKFSKGNITLLVILIIIVLIGAGIITAIYFYQKNNLVDEAPKPIQTQMTDQASDAQIDADIQALDSKFQSLDAEQKTVESTVTDQAVNLD